jgi:hypothetical protein
MKKNRFHGHTDLDLLGLVKVKPFDPRIHPPAFLQRHHSGTIGVLSAVALRNHGGRRDPDRREGSQLAPPAHVNPFHIGAVAIDTYLPRGNEKGAAFPAARTHEFFFTQKLLVGNITEGSCFHGLISSQKW